MGSHTPLNQSAECHIFPRIPTKATRITTRDLQGLYSHRLYPPDTRSHTTQFPINDHQRRVARPESSKGVLEHRPGRLARTPFASMLRACHPKTQATDDTA